MKINSQCKTQCTNILIPSARVTLWVPFMILLKHFWCLVLSAKMVKIVEIFRTNSQSSDVERKGQYQIQKHLIRCHARTRSYPGEMFLTAFIRLAVTVWFSMLPIFWEEKTASIELRSNLIISTDVVIFRTVKSKIKGN